MKLNRRQLGDIGESIACSYLEQSNYQIVAQNFRINRGEIDIIALDQKTLVFCEVKTRSTISRGLPAEAISPLKLKHIRQVALSWLGSHYVPHTSIRFDLISVLEPLSKKPQIEHLRDIEL